MFKYFLLLLATISFHENLISQNISYNRAKLIASNERSKILIDFNDAISLQNKAKYIEALGLFNKVVENYPSYYKASYSNYSINYKLKRYNDALKDVEKMYEFKRKDSKYFFYKAICYNKLGKSKLAHQYYEFGLQVEEDNNLQIIQNANLYLKDGQYDKAIEYYDLCLDIEPKNYNIYYSRGIAKYNKKMFNEACQDWYDVLLENEPSNKMYFYKCTNHKAVNKTKKDTIPKARLELPLFTHPENLSIEEFLLNKLQVSKNFIINQTQGTVLLQFMIKKDSTISDIKVINGLSLELNNEVIRLVKESGKYWLPAQKNYKAVNQELIIPITFKINENYFKQIKLLNAFNSLKSNDYNEIIRLGTEILKFNPFHFETYNKVMANLNKSTYKNIQFNYNYLREIEKNVHVLNEVFCTKNLIKIYFNDKWQVCDKDSASYYRITNWSETYNYQEGKIFDFYKSDTLFMEGEYLSKRKEGRFVYYNPKGKIKKHIYFLNNEANKEFAEYFENGKLKLKLNIAEDFEFVELNDSSSNSLLFSGNGVFSYSYLSADENDILRLEGYIQKNKKDGTWSYYFNDELIVEEIYSKGKYKSGKYHNENNIGILNEKAIGPWTFVPLLLNKQEAYEIDTRANFKAFSFLYTYSDRD